MSDAVTEAPGIDTSPAPVGIGNATEPVAPAATEQPDWENADDTDLTAIFRKNNPEREQDGKFAAREPKEPVLTDQAQTGVVEQQAAAINAPVSWSAEMKATFATLPPAIQEFVSKRETEASEKISQQGRELSTYEPIKSVIEQHKDIFERNGLDYSDGLGRMLNAERMLERDPVAAIGMIAQAYGVDLGQYSGGQQSGTDPNTALHQRIAQLEGQLNNTAKRVEERETADNAQRVQSIATIIEKFAADKPDWADLEKDIETEIVGIKAAISQKLMQPMPEAEVLQKAYDRAQRNNPDAWAKKLETDKKAEEVKRIELAKKQAEDAKRAKAVNINSSPANGKAAISSWEDDLKTTYRKLNSA